MTRLHNKALSDVSIEVSNPDLSIHVPEVSPLLDTTWTMEVRRTMFVVDHMSFCLLVTGSLLTANTTNGRYRTRQQGSHIPQNSN